MLRIVILFDKVKRILCFLDLWSFLCICGIFHMGIHIKAWWPKLGSVLQLCSYQCGRRTTSHVSHPSMRLALLFGDKTVNSCPMCVKNNMQIPFCRTSAHLAAPLLHWCHGHSYSKGEALHIFLWDSILCDEYVNFFFPFRCWVMHSATPSILFVFLSWTKGTNIKILFIVPHENINLKIWAGVYTSIHILIHYHPLTNKYELFH